MTQSSGDDPLAALKPYMHLASGLVGISAAKAAEIAQGLLSSGSGDQTEPDESAEASPFSVDQVRVLVREEVDRAARRMGFVREDEIASLRREVDRIERQVAGMSIEMSSLATALADHEELASQPGRSSAAEATPRKNGKKKHKSKSKHAGAGEGDR